MGPRTRFQFTHARGVRHGSPPPARSNGSFQFTHARGVRPVAGGGGVAAQGVSIHARAGRATDGADHLRESAAVSIHARAGRATRTTGRRAASRASFNSRTRGACDQRSVRRPCPAGCFNSRTRGACDYLDATPQAPSKSFQFTHARGVRLEHAGQVALDGGVSIHARAGRATQRYTAITQRIDMFQFTHARGVRPSLP